MTLELR